jgi:hypothetical protein
MKKYTIEVSFEVGQEDVDNILDSAINWCSHWCNEMIVSKRPTEEPPEGTSYVASEFITRGGELTFTIDEPYEEGEETEFVLTLDKFLKGIADYGEFDFDQFDGPMSDAVLQQALFGEVVYG